MLYDAIYIINTQQTPKRSIDDNFFDVQGLLKTDKGQTHLLTIMTKTLIIICHAQTYICVWCSRY